MPEPAPSPTARPPKRLFRLGPLGDPIAVPPAEPDGPWDDPSGDRALHLFATRRGALLAALGAIPAVSPDRLAGATIVPVRLDDPRPFLDLRDPAALPPDLAALLAGGDAARRRPLEWAGASGLAGVVDAIRDHPAQTCWAVPVPGAVVVLAAPRPLSPHDPDLVAVLRLLARPAR